LYAAGYEYEEIATLLGIKISTVRSHMSNARRQLSETVSRKRKGHGDERGGTRR
jgi:DNA-directed RNA polymerase specialized sigma24 family protein